MNIDVYNSGDLSIFPVSSTLITGDRDSILVDAQFQRNDAECLAEMIVASGKRLASVFISHGDTQASMGSRI